MSLPAETIRSILDMLLADCDMKDEGVSHRTFQEFCLVSKGVRSSCRWLHQVGLGFVADCIKRNPDRLSKFRVVWYELSADRLAALKAIVLNPLLAAVIDEIQLSAWAPDRDLGDEFAFKATLKRKLRHTNNYLKGTEFERECAIQAHWLESRESFLESLHMLNKGHDLEILQAAKPHLKSLKRLTLHCDRQQTRSSLRSLCFYPDFTQTVKRDCIDRKILGRPTHYRGLANFAKIFGKDSSIKSVILDGVDLQIAQLPEPDLANIHNLMRTVDHLELRCSPDKNFMSTQSKHIKHLHKCRTLFSGLHQLKYMAILFKPIRQWIQLGGDVNGLTICQASQLLECILSKTQFPNLQEFAVSNTRVTPAALHEFLRRHRQSLEGLILDRLLFGDYLPCLKQGTGRQSYHVRSRWVPETAWDTLAAEVRGMTTLKEAKVIARDNVFLQWRSTDRTHGMFLHQFAVGDRDSRYRPKEGLGVHTWFVDH